MRRGDRTEIERVLGDEPKKEREKCDGIVKKALQRYNHRRRK